MPYIDQRNRNPLDIRLEPLMAFQPSQWTAGELNYVLTKIANAWLGWDYDYDRLSDVIKSFECAKLEFYRKMVVPYENGKADKNGDVYP